MPPYFPTSRAPPSFSSPLSRHRHRRNVENVGGNNTIKTLRNFDGEEILLLLPLFLSLDIILDREAFRRGSSDRDITRDDSVTRLPRWYWRREVKARNQDLEIICVSLGNAPVGDAAKSILRAKEEAKVCGMG